MMIQVGQDGTRILHTPQVLGSPHAALLSRELAGYLKLSYLPWWSLAYSQLQVVGIHAAVCGSTLLLPCHLPNLLSSCSTRHRRQTKPTACPAWDTSLLVISSNISTGDSWPTASWGRVRTLLLLLLPRLPPHHMRGINKPLLFPRQRLTSLTPPLPSLLLPFSSAYMERGVWNDG